MRTSTEAPQSLGELLREWRALRGMSQLELALEAEVSSRHVSFVETGRSRPSREMVLRLTEALELPLRERNAALLAAGHAPLYPQRPLDADDLEPVRQALELMLASHEPYPAFVLDAGWNIVLANRAHHRLLGLLLPGGVAEPVNVMRLVLDPRLLRPRVANWPLVAQVLGRRLRQRLRSPGLTPGQRRQLESLLACPGVERAMAAATPPPASAVLVPLELELEGRRLAWFSMLASIGTPLDVTLEEIRVESLFPADAATAEAAHQLAESAHGEP